MLQKNEIQPGEKKDIYLLVGLFVSMFYVSM